MINYIFRRKSFKKLQQKVDNFENYFFPNFLVDTKSQLTEVFVTQKSLNSIMYKNAHISKTNRKKRKIK